MELDVIKDILNKQASYNFLVKVFPRASNNYIEAGQANYLLKIYLKTLPIDGQANQALLQFLQKKLKPLLVEIKIIKGQRSSLKLLKIQLKK